MTSNPGGRKGNGVFARLLRRRRGFVISPRIAFPVLVVLVLAMFVVFFTLDSGAISMARIASTVLVSIALIVMFGILALLSRIGRDRRPSQQ